MNEGLISFLLAFSGWMTALMLGSFALLYRGLANEWRQSCEEVEERYYRFQRDLSKTVSGSDFQKTVRDAQQAALADAHQSNVVRFPNVR